MLIATLKRASIGALALAVIALPTHSLYAQDTASPLTVRGRLLLENGQLASGVHVVATVVGGTVGFEADRAADSTPVAKRTITSLLGVFELQLPRGRITLTARRIGHSPVELTTLDLSAGGSGVEDTRALESVLRDAPVSLVPVVSRVSNRCVNIGGAAPELVSLVEDVRQALRGVQFIAPERATLSRVMLTQASASRDGRKVSSSKQELRAGVNARPFQSLDPRALRRVGYMTVESDGTVWHAPDSRVLSSDEFLEDHCFGVLAQNDETPGRLGITFQPANRRRDAVLIRGTFWLDRETRELRELEFAYVGLSRDYERTIGRHHRVPQSGGWHVL